MRFAIRRATKADLPSLGRLGALLVEQHHGFDRRRFLADDSRTPETYARFLGNQLEEPDALVLAAEDAGQIVGYTFSQMDGPDFKALRGPAALLHDLLVGPDHRGRGIAARLVEETVALWRERGARQILLSTACQNLPAQRLFARLGFRATMIEMTRELDD